MRFARLLVHKRPVFLVTGALALALSFLAAMAGQKALSGYVAGLVGTGVSLFGTWAAVKWVSKVMQDGSPSWQGAAAPVSAMVIKLPVLLAAMFWVQRLGGPATSWFLAGLALVYSATVWWALGTHDPPTDTTP